MSAAIANEHQLLVLLIQAGTREIQQLIVRAQAIGYTQCFHDSSLRRSQGFEAPRIGIHYLPDYFVSTIRFTRSFNAGVLAYLSHTDFSASTNCFLSTSLINFTPDLFSAAFDSFSFSAQSF